MDKIKTFCRQQGVRLLLLLHVFGLIAIALISKELAAFSAINLLITFAVIGLAHRGKKQNFWAFFTLSYLIGYGVEYLGTQTGFPFGDYSYGQNLAPLLFEVPLIIGVNWFVLAMAAGYFTQNIISNQWLRIPVAALIMVFIDFFIEKVAPILDYWSWKDAIVPLVNYLGWFVVSLIVQVLWTVFLRKSENSVAQHYLWIVLGFFIILILAL
jgi:putative membrane protein